MTTNEYNSMLTEALVAALKRTFQQLQYLLLAGGLIFVLTGCASEIPVVATDQPAVTQTSAPTATVTPIVVMNGTAINHDALMAFAQVEGILFTANNQPYDSEGVVVADDGSMWMYNTDLGKMVNMNIPTEWILVSLSPNDKGALQAELSDGNTHLFDVEKGKWVEVEKISRVENFGMHIDEKTQQFVSEAGYSSWNELMDVLVLNNPNMPFRGRDLNKPMIPKMYGDKKDLLIPYTYGVNQGYVLESEWIDVSNASFWQDKADRVLFLYVAFPHSKEVAMVPMKSQVAGESSLDVVPYIYDNNGGKSRIDEGANDLVGRLLVFRLAMTLGMGPNASQGYMDRLTTYKNDPRWDYFYETQIKNRTPKERELFEYLITNEDGPLFQLTMWYINHAVPTEETKAGKSGSFLVYTYDSASFESPFVLADLILTENGQLPLWNDPAQ